MLVVKFHPTEYTECQALYPVVRIGSFQFPHPQASVAPPPLGKTNSLAGGGGTPNSDEGTDIVVLYVQYNPLVLAPSHALTVLQAGSCVRYLMSNDDVTVNSPRVSPS
jgi:hypothetical protein